MGLLDWLRGEGGAEGRDAGGPADERRVESVGASLDNLAQPEPYWSTEALRRRIRDVFFAVQRSWIERDPAVGEPFMTQGLTARQRLRIEGLVRQKRVHQLENPLIEDLDFVRMDEASQTDDGLPRVVALLDMSLVETILDADTGALVAGAANEKLRRRQFWVFVRRDERWLLEDVEQPGEGERHFSAPLVGGDYARLSPEMALRERYARGEIEIEEFERELARLLQRGPTY